MFDFILKGGDIIDGTGQKRFLGDIAITGDTIVAVGQLGFTDGSETAEIIDVSGLVVAPGFVDLHTHSDFTLMADGRAESQVHQGVTTEVVGQCGISCAPVCSHAVIPTVSPWYTDKATDATWRSFGEYLDALEQVDTGVNVLAFVGHGTVHRAVVGDALRAGEPEEISHMTRLVEDAIDQGAAGFSTGLEYWPGILATPEQIVPLCQATARKGRLYATHVRNRDTCYDLGFAEALSTARQAGVRLQISHIQPKFGAPDHAMEHTLGMVEQARKYGVDVAFDIIPHDWNHTTIVSILPKWARSGGVKDIMTRLRDPKARARIKANPQPMWLIVKARKWRDIALLNACENKNLVGADFEEIGRMRGVDPYDAVLDILLEEGEQMIRSLWTSKSFRNDDIDLCLQQPECAVISDTVATANDGILKDHIGSLSGYGWAARFLQHYVRDRKVITLENAIQKITALPADRLGLKERGRLKKGQKADICVFDPNTITSNCTARHPRRYATGIAHVFVNGQPAMRNGKRTEQNKGAVIRNIA